MTEFYKSRAWLNFINHVPFNSSTSQLAQIRGRLSINKLAKLNQKLDLQRKTFSTPIK
jgi:hypothetical protein